MRLLAIDPGNTESGWALIETDDCRPLAIGKTPNRELLGVWDDLGPHYVDRAAIEMVRSYGMAVGAEVFETCVWIGRFDRDLEVTLGSPDFVTLVYRGDVKLHLCHSTKAKDGNVIQALVDRFAPGQPNRGKGTKSAPGWFYGFAGDMWQAYALAVQQADTIEGRDA